MDSVFLIKQGLSGIRGLTSGRGRYWRALTASARLVALYAGSDSREQADRRGARIVMRLCRRNGAFWVKAAQFFSCRPDALPRAYIEQFQTLQNDANPLPFATIRKTLVKAWGQNWQDQFRWINPEPAAVASIAQVHQACLKDGSLVAIKVRLPGVKRVFEQDARVFQALGHLVGPLLREFDLVQAIDQLVQMTTMELDFRNERANMARFQRLQHHPRVKVPEPVAALSGERVMVSSWEEGERLRDFLDEHPEQAEDLLGVLLTSYLQQVTRFGVYQADPHPGNFLVTSNRDVVILDYGAIGILTADEVRRYSRLLYGLMGFAGEVDIGELFVQAGFRGGRPETLRDLALYVLTDRLNQQGPVAAMGELMARFREERIRIPDSYIGISRVLITLGGFLMSYGVAFDWTPPEQRPGS